ncbi:PH domain-containing protein [Paraburkholderia strydomiana]|jgi:membrane protein YdbS with pleckstrin-like domain|uniref:PH domain-containing protein n=1 Tax=Paraburkholderia strydomiana TaxID=1245417 RepID=A0ABW9ED54_9BURK
MALSPVNSQFADAQPNQAAPPFSTDDWSRRSEKGIYAMANQVIFSGAPSQACNLPALLKGGVVMAMIGGVHLCTSNSFPFQWNVLLAQAGAVLIGVAVPFVKTAFTRIVIDTARISWTQGILHRRVSTLELSRIQCITSIHPWWQRPFGIGTVILTTTDAAHPLRRLPGISNADQLCKRLGEAVAMHRERLGSAYTNDPNARGYSQVHGM